MDRNSALSLHFSKYSFIVFISLGINEETKVQHREEGLEVFSSRTGDAASPSALLHSSRFFP